MEMRVVTRVITHDRANNAVLLVKNRGQDFWYPPGGGWHYDKENIIECAEREVLEETGLAVRVKRLLYVQEFHDAWGSLSFELFWLAEPVEGAELDELHVDRDVDGVVEKARWFTRDEIQGTKVFPERLYNTFWQTANKLLDDENPFIGVNSATEHAE